jgi:hypothetical protein
VPERQYSQIIQDQLLFLGSALNRAHDDFLEVSLESGCRNCSDRIICDLAGAEVYQNLALLPTGTSLPATISINHSKDGYRS